MSERCERVAQYLRPDSWPFSPTVLTLGRSLASLMTRTAKGKIPAASILTTRKPVKRTLKPSLDRRRATRRQPRKGKQTGGRKGVYKVTLLEGGERKLRAGNKFGGEGRSEKKKDQHKEPHGRSRTKADAMKNSRG